ncbi:MAG: hypothetical protein AAFU85_23680 [Planctomycetota bacterium]
MGLEELKTAWQSERGIESSRFEAICERFYKGSARIRSVILQRDGVETAVAAAFLVAMAIGLAFATNWTMRISLGFGCLGCILIPICLWWGRRLMQPPGLSFRGYVEAEIEFLERQVFLLTNIVWWYELPLGVAMVLFPMGANDWNFDATSRVVFVIYQTVILSVLIWVWWINQRAVAINLRPLLEYHVRLRAALDEGDEALDSVAEPPAGFIEKLPPEPMSRRAQRWWIAGILFAFGAVIIAGVWLVQQFDLRTGVFVAVCAPVVAGLVLFVSGIWKRPVKDDA